MHDKEFLAHFYYKKKLMPIKPQNQDDQADDSKVWMEWRQRAGHAMVIVAADIEDKGVQYYYTSRSRSWFKDPSQKDQSDQIQ
jgi:hypothetical protein